MINHMKIQSLLEYSIRITPHIKIEQQTSIHHAY